MSRIFHLAKFAQERGTYPIKLTIKDSYKLVVNTGNINEINWWLTDSSGNIINGRSNESIAVANPLFLVLKDEDLQITDKTVGENFRLVTFRGTYNSDLGNDLPFTYVVSFNISNSVIVDSDLFINVVDTVFSADFVYV